MVSFGSANVWHSVLGREPLVLGWHWLHHVYLEIIYLSLSMNVNVIIKLNLLGWYQFGLYYLHVHC